MICLSLVGFGVQLTFQALALLMYRSVQNLDTLDQPRVRVRIWKVLTIRKVIGREGGFFACTIFPPIPPGFAGNFFESNCSLFF